MSVTQQREKTHREIYEFYLKQKGTNFTNKWVPVYRKYGCAKGTLVSIIKKYEDEKN